MRYLARSNHGTPEERARSSSQSIKDFFRDRMRVLNLTHGKLGRRVGYTNQYSSVTNLLQSKYARTLRHL